MHRAKPVAILLLALLALAPLAAPAAAQPLAPARLTLDRLFLDREFAPKRFGPARWLADGSGYTTLQPSPAFPGDDARDIVRFDPATGRREVLVSAAQLVPPAGAPGEKPGEKPAGKAPLEIDDYQWSADGKKLLVFTNTRRVWRQNTRGDYWVLDRATGRLAKLGGREAEPSTLMFAKLSPDATRVAYVRRENLYVEDLATGEVRALTTGGNPKIINGTFDWVYEEELDLRDGWRWSPDGRSIAYWQIDARAREGLPPHQQHRHPLPGGHANPLPEGGRADLLRAHRGRLRRGRRDAVARRPGRPAPISTSPAWNGRRTAARSSSSASIASRTRST